MYVTCVREYSLTMGRFLQRDPIDTADQINLYTYVGNSPLRWVDAMGMDRDPLDTITEKFNYY